MYPVELASNLYGYILFICLLMTAVFLFTSYVLFYVYRVPVYHVIAVYQIYFLLGFVVRPWELLLTGKSQLWGYTGLIPTGETILWSAIVLIAAHAAMMLGFYVANPVGRTVKPLEPFTFSLRRPLAYFVIAIAFLILGIYSSYVQFGAFSSLEDTLNYETEVDAAGGGRNLDVSGYQVVFEELIPVTLIALFAVKRTRYIAIPLLLAFITYRMFAGAGRHKFVLTALVVGAIYLIEQRRRLPTLRMCAFALGLLAVFTVLGADRLALRKIFDSQSSFSEVIDNFVETRGDSIVSSDFKEFDVLTDILEIVPEQSGYTYGTQYLRLFVWPIPRGLWPDKPVFTSSVNLLEYGNFFALTLTFFGDSYMTLGILGMIVIVFGISLFINGMYNKVLRSDSGATTLIYLMVLMYTPILLRDGPVEAIYFVSVTSLGAVLLCWGGGAIRRSANRRLARRKKIGRPIAVAAINA